MLPIRASAPIRRSEVLVVEVRVPSEGTWFAALATSVKSKGLFLSTSRELAVGTTVSVVLPGAADPGALVVDGLVTVRIGASDDGRMSAVRVMFDALPDDVRERLERLSTRRASRHVA